MSYQCLLKTYIIMIVISAKKVRGESITCTNPNGCNWVCNGNQKCDQNIYHCPSTSDYCHLTCTSCTSLQVFSSSDIFNIDCMDGKGCTDMEITAQTPTSSINLHCGSGTRCKDITIYCPADTLHQCKCINNNVQNNICEWEVSITPMVQRTTSQHPIPSTSEYIADVTTSSTSYFTTMQPTRLPSKYPTSAPIMYESTHSQGISTSAMIYKSTLSQAISTTADLQTKSSATYPSAIVSTTRDKSAYEAEKIELSSTHSSRIFTEEYMTNNAQVNTVNGIVFGGISTLALFIAVGFLYYLYKKSKPKSNKNVFGFEAEELENDTDAEEITEIPNLPKEEKKSVSSYIMTVVDKSDPVRTRGESGGVFSLNNFQTPGAFPMTNDGIMVVEESMSGDEETHDAMYGPGACHKLHPTLGCLETVELGNVETAVIVHSDSD